MNRPPERPTAFIMVTAVPVLQTGVNPISTTRFPVPPSRELYNYTVYASIYGLGNPLVDTASVVSASGWPFDIPSLSLCRFIIVIVTVWHAIHLLHAWTTNRQVPRI